MASKSKLSQIFENSSKNLFDTMKYNWGIGYMEEQMPEKTKNPELPSNKPGAKETKKMTKLERLKKAIGEARASDYRTKHKERMKKFLIERAYTAKG